MIRKKELVLALLVLALRYATPFEFEPTDDEEVYFGEESDDGQMVSADEYNYGGTMKLVKVTGAVGDVSLKVVSTNAAIFKPRIEDDDGEIIVASNKVDYEALGSFKRLVLTISDDSDSKTLIVEIINLVDEYPTISLDGTCVIKEEEYLTDPNDSNCSFTVSDTDGWLNYLVFTIPSEKEAELFTFKYRSPPSNTTYSAKIYLVLQDDQKLDYETTTLYTFYLKTEDAVGHPSIPEQVQIIVQVEDIPDTPPQWDSNFRSAMRIVEEQEATFTVTARDGDYGINSPITYSVIDPSGHASIDSETGTVTLTPIDRDVLEIDEIIIVIVAKEVWDPYFEKNGTITLIIEDIDDNWAVVTVDGASDNRTVLYVNETSSSIDDLFISANDIDLGENATYNVKLTSENPDFPTAFMMIPNRGYQLMDLSLLITEPKKLDYEDDEWRNINITLVTEGIHDPSHIWLFDIEIHLLDWNDEIPQFPQLEYFVSVREDVKRGYNLNVTILATDRDREDIEKGLKHELLGSLANNILEIAPLGGNISTKKDNAFDYDKQPEVIIQIQATDAVGHTNTTQLNITVLDVNNKDPVLTVSSTIFVEENQPDGYVLDAAIEAYDVDTTADLEFSIDWSTSYATKNSQKLKDEIFDGLHCVKVETVHADPEDNHRAQPILSLIETQKNNTPDYEVYDTLYIRLVVTDKETEVGNGTDSTLIAISIIDINDNPPIFNEPPDVNRQVVENSPNGTVISTIVATDADVGTIMTYYIEPLDDTPNWVAIDNYGTLTVSLKEGEVLDCDDGPIWNLTYVVTAKDNDEVHSTSHDITIGMIDQNDNKPEVKDQSGSVTEDNKITGEKVDDGTVVLTIDYYDHDRDESYHTITCAFTNNPTSFEAAQRFQIFPNNTIVVNRASKTLNREEHEVFDFQMTCADDPQRQGNIQNTVNANVNITLIDVNDNYPIIKTSDITGLSENSQGVITQKLEGEDLDAGDNGLIEYVNITKIERTTDSEPDPVEITDEIFNVTTDEDQKSGILTIKTDNLEGYYGRLTLTILLRDLGTPPLEKESTVVLEVKRYNFKELVFDFPEDGATYFLQTIQTANAQLVMWNGVNRLQNLLADDQQNYKYVITFSIVDDPYDGLFTIRTITQKESQMQLTTSDFKPQKYSLKIRATVDGDEIDNKEAPYFKDLTFNIDFFDKDATDPIFETHEDSFKIYENDPDAFYELPKAIYPDLDENITKGLEVFYLLISGDNDYKTKFHLDKKTGNLTLLEPLDYETYTNYSLIIQSSNIDSIKQDAVDDTKFNLIIIVIDVNDNAPVFDQKEYTAILNIAHGDINSHVQTVSATDVDTTSIGKLVYEIVSIKGNTEELDKIPDAFKISNAGVITTNFNAKDGYKGHFTINLIVKDEDSLNDTATVTVYLVTTDNIVTFNFENEQQTVIDTKEDMEDILNEEFPNYQCKVDVTKAEETRDDGTVTTAQTVYFVERKTQEPVPAAEIYKLVVNTNVYQELKKKFLEKTLILMSFQSASEGSTNMEDILKAWLIGVSVVLGALCLILLVAFILKTRTLNQRINKLSNTKFGSQESNLNRLGIPAPTTNKHAVEGSNPVYNNSIDTKDIDRRSVTSGDSDLIGVEDDEKFNYNLNSFENTVEDDGKFNYNPNSIDDRNEHVE